MDLQALAGRAVAAALGAGAGQAEAFALQDSGREVRVHGGSVESLTAATERGMGVRAWSGGRVGFAYGTDIGEEGAAEIAARAASGAASADPDEFAAAPEPAGRPPEIAGLSDPSLTAWDAGRVAELALAVERAALAADGRIAGVEQAVYADSSERVAISSSTGIEGAYEATSCYAYLQAMAEGDGGRETGLGFGLARGPQGLDPEGIGREAAERAVAMIGAGKPESRACPVVLEPTVAAGFIGLVGSTLGADAVQRGRSPFAERLGSEVAAEALVLTDDGLDPGGLATSPFDGEGLARRRTPLIEGGRLRSFLHDSYTARRGGTESTASAGRSGYRSTPGVSASNLVVAEGERDLAALLTEAGDGVLVSDVAGLHSGVNPVTGVFSVGASGRLISAGELTDPVREFTIASDLVSMLGAVGAAGSEGRWVPFGGSVRAPHLLVAEMTVSGA
ncbi:MAG: TldD/PmbA family protein [Solirubrobacterales bacterium]